ncbi:CRISP [Lepeophtheirus salmonis]|uniref:CRISP n=3 Tax=Lepeophtheirus salmonis TaxID=72036 RepID=A0A7R8D678_LEPSM|nr:CRISP [Lepeophtheirus salmonis]CAF3042326.1 CRISP [Lepeophtheirus salmonis]
MNIISQFVFIYTLLKDFAQTTAPALASSVLNEQTFKNIRPFEKSLANTSGTYYHLNDVYEYEEETVEFKGHRNFQVMELNLPSCKGPMTSQGLSEKEKKMLHNDLRKKISNGTIEGLPRAKFMNTMYWNSSLEDECKKWLNRCPDGFNHAHPPSSWQAFPYGQNMAWGQDSIKEAAVQWFDEYKPYIEAGVDPLIYRDSTDEEVQDNKLGMIGHFTAMTNAKSFAIGCYKVVADIEVIDFQTIYCCNYSPPGNENYSTRSTMLTTQSTTKKKKTQQTPTTSTGTTVSTRKNNTQKQKIKPNKSKKKRSKSKAKRKSKSRKKGRKSKGMAKKSQIDKPKTTTSSTSKKAKEDDRKINETGGLVSLLKDKEIKSFRDKRVVVVLVNPPIETDTVEVSDLKDIEDNLIESFKSHTQRNKFHFSMSLQNNSDVELINLYS